MNIRTIPLLLNVVKKGEIKKIFYVGWYEVYQGYYNMIFSLKPKHRNKSKKNINVLTKHPIAFKSPDHLVPWGTKNDNSTHKKFVLKMDEIMKKSKNKEKSFLDLGCSGGQLVKDFLDMGWVAVGLEGSDYSLKFKRANWSELAKKNLFTCDITKPFEIKLNKKNHKFQLITAWEVLEHINKKDLKNLFNNIVKNLDSGGYFIASTTSHPDIHDGVDLHQTKMTNKAWRAWMRKSVPELEPIDLGLKYYQFVRYNSEHAYLVYRKK